MWFDAGELPRAAGLRFDDRATGEAMSAAKRTSFRCPVCTVPIYERELGDRSSLMVEQCPRCSGLFLDREEFSRAKRHFRASGAHELKRRARSEPVQETTHIDEDSLPLTLFQYLTGLPLELNAPQTLLPPVVVALVAINVVVFAVTAWHGLDGNIARFGLVPREVRGLRDLHTMFTSMFMHGGFFHLFGNMYFLYVLGDNVEGRLGWHRFLVFYLVCGLFAGALHVAGHPNSQIPAVGASGAISGILGAYLVFFPHNRLLLRYLWRWGFWVHPVRWEVPAWAYLGFWILMQVLFATLNVPGVAWYAHVGGFISGVGVALGARLLRREPAEERDWELTG
jgi:membrane associated rhomboid family serine protease